MAGPPYAPMLAVAGTLGDVAGGGWASEFKWDGVRVIAEVRGGTARLWSRRGNDVTATYPEVADLGRTGLDAVLDGEVVAFDATGRPSFARIQQRMNVRDRGRVEAARTRVPVAYVVFDLLRLDGREVLTEPYAGRRERLEGLVLAGGAWRVPPSSRAEPAAVRAVAVEHGLEGIVAKRLDSPYRPGARSPAWRKLPIHRREVFVVGGFRPGQGSRAARFGSLVVGYHDAGGALRYAGTVGSGLSHRELDEVGAWLDGNARPDSPFADPVPHADARWVEPRLVVEVRFSEWTPDRVLRKPTYVGARTDVAPHDVVTGPDG